MKKPDKLFELVQSMSMSEKRYFKLYANRHTIGEKNNYTVIFEVLEQMDDYHHEELVDRLEKAGVSTRHLSSDKNYLYNHILKGLSAFYIGKTVSLRIKEYLHQVEILYERGLYDHCIALMKKAKSMAAKYDIYPLLLEILYWERKALGQKGQINKVKSSLEESIGTLALLDNSQAFMKLYYQIIGMRRSITKARSKEAVEALEQFMEHPFLSSEHVPLSFQAKLHFWRIYAMYYFSVDDPEQELMANQKLLDLMYSNDNYVQEFPYDVVVIYSRILTLKIDAPDEEYQQQLAFFRSFPKRIKKARRNVEARVMTDSYSIEMMRLIETGKLAEALELVPSMQDVLKKYKKQMTDPQRITYQYLFAYANLANKNIHEALVHVNILLNEFDEKVRPEIHGYVRLLNLITHYEIGNYDLLKYQAESTQRFMEKHKRLHKMEEMFLRFFKKLSRSRGQDDPFEQELFKNLKTELEQIFVDPLERKVLDYFDVMTWVDTHIYHTSFIEAKRQRLAQ